MGAFIENPSFLGEYTRFKNFRILTDIMVAQLMIWNIHTLHKVYKRNKNILNFYGNFTVHRLQDLHRNYII